MKIAICGSVGFAKEILETKQKLESQGHEVTVPKNLEKYISKKIAVEDKWLKLESDVIKEYYEEIQKADAILVLNYDKNKIKNYVGGNALIETAFAHVLGKKIFFLNPIPEMSYSDELASMKSIIINGDFSKIER